MRSKCLIRIRPTKYACETAFIYFRQSHHHIYLICRISTPVVRLNQMRVLQYLIGNGQHLCNSATYTSAINAVSSTKTTMSTRNVDVQLELAEWIKRIRAFVRECEMMYGYRSDLFLPNFGRATLPMMFKANIYGKTASAS